MSALERYTDLAKDDSFGTITFQIPEKRSRESLQKATYVSLSTGCVYEYYTEVLNIGNLSWKLKIDQVYEPKAICAKEVFSVRICCNEKSKNPMWSCEAGVLYQFIQQRSNSEPKIVHEVRVEPIRYDCSHTVQEDPSCCTIIGFTDESSPNITIKADISVRNMVGVRKRRRFDFDSSIPDLADFALVVQGKKMFVNKMFLGMFSPIFHAMFFSDAEIKSEIELEDVEYDDFKELLHVVYPSPNDIRKSTYEKMLELADRFQIESVIDKCEKFLISDTTIESSKKLSIAQKYKLSELMNACIQSYTSIEDMQKMLTHKSFEELNYDTKAALLERAFQLAE